MPVDTITVQTTLHGNEFGLDARNRPVSRLADGKQYGVVLHNPSTGELIGANGTSVSAAKVLASFGGNLANPVSPAVGSTGNLTGSFGLPVPWIKLAAGTLVVGTVLQISAVFRRSGTLANIPVAARFGPTKGQFDTHLGAPSVSNNSATNEATLTWYVVVGDTTVHAMYSGNVTSNGAVQNTSGATVEITIDRTVDNYVTFDCQGVNARATAAVIGSGKGGTGYTVNDVLTVSGGTGTAATLTVTTVSSGAITFLSVTTAGNYSAVPTNYAGDVTVTGGTGTGATPTITWAADTLALIGGAVVMLSAPTQATRTSLLSAPTSWPDAFFGMNSQVWPVSGTAPPLKFGTFCTFGTKTLHWNALQTNANALGANIGHFDTLCNTNKAAGRKINFAMYGCPPAFAATGNGSTAITFTGALTAATSGTLNSAWGGTTGSAYACLFSDGSTRVVTLTNGATTCTWTGAVTATASATVGAANSGATGPWGDVSELAYCGAANLGQVTYFLTQIINRANAIQDGIITSIQLHNEPDPSQPGAMTAAQMVDFMWTCYQAIKAADPRIVVLTPGTYDLNNATYGLSQWINTAGVTNSTKRGYDCFDAIAAHPYHARPMGQQYSGFGDILGLSLGGILPFRQTLKTYGKGSADYYITEYGVSSGYDQELQWFLNSTTAAYRKAWIGRLLIDCFIFGVKLFGGFGHGPSQSPLMGDLTNDTTGVIAGWNELYDARAGKTLVDAGFVSDGSRYLTFSDGTSYTV